MMIRHSSRVHADLSVPSRLFARTLLVLALLVAAWSARADAQTITGTVTDAGTGAPLDGVSVYVYDATGKSMGSVTTNASGVYTKTGLATGTHYVRTSNTLGYLDEVYNNIPCPSGNCTATSGTGVSVTAGATTSGINFALVAGGRISGTVTDVVTGAPLAGVYVYVYSATGSSVGSSVTNTSGVYTTSTGLPTGTYYPRTYNSAGYIDEQFNNLPCPGSSCSVTSGTGVSVTVGATTSAIDFGLAPGGRISGTVTDAGTGAPLAGVYVSVYNASGNSVGSSVTTNASGVYTTSTGLLSGTYYVRTSNSLGYVDELYDNIPCPSGSCTVTSGAGVSVTAGVTTGGINFGLAVGGHISGTVTHAGTGAPLAVVYVSVYNASGNSLNSVYTNSSGESHDHPLPSRQGADYVRTSNTEGYLDELYNNIPCPYSCSVTTGTGVSVTAGATTSGINFGLALGGRISGTVTDARTGAPLAGVYVNVYDASGSFATYGYANASGMYTTSTGVPTGTYFVMTQYYYGYLDQLYNNILCPGSACSVTSGTAVSVTAGATTSGINFALVTSVAGGDFTGDLKSDILWRHATRGDVWLWPMNGAAKVSETLRAARWPTRTGRSAARAT